MVAGDPTTWAGRFRSFDVRFLKRVAAVWPKCIGRLPKQPDEDPITIKEDPITINLVDLLNRDRETHRWFHYIEFQYEPVTRTAEGAAYSTGRIDMAVILNQDRDIYLAYECKRLNLVRQDGRRSLAGNYVKDGLSRFVVEQYAKGLPLACMLGYVLDGDLEYAESSVRSRIAELCEEVGLVAEPRDAAPIGESKRFFSRHRRPSGSDIEVRHALFPVGPGLRTAVQAAEPGRGRRRRT